MSESPPKEDVAAIVLALGRAAMNGWGDGGDQGRRLISTHRSMP